MTRCLTTACCVLAAALAVIVLAWPQMRAPDLPRTERERLAAELLELRASLEILAKENRVYDENNRQLFLENQRLRDLLHQHGISPDAPSQQSDPQ